MLPHLTFVHISDSHIGPTRDYETHGRRTFDCLDRLVSVINDFPQPPDFVLHTGDVTENHLEASYQVAQEALSRLNVPVYYVGGNHDRRAFLRQYMGAKPSPDGDPDAPLNYMFEVKGERFLVLDTFSPQVKQPQGYVSESQLAILRAESEQDGPPLTVVIHHNPLKMASPWLDANMPIVNGDDFHAALLPGRGRLRGVFHGHLHRSVQIARQGITYFCAPGTAFQYAWRLWDETPQVDSDYPPAYNLVIYLGDQVVVHEYAFEV